MCDLWLPVFGIYATRRGSKATSKHQQYQPLRSGKIAYLIRRDVPVLKIGVYL